MAAKHSRNFVFIFLRFLTSLCIIRKYHRFESRIITRTTHARSIHRSFTPRDWLLGFYTRRFVPWTRKSEYFLVLTYSRLVSLQFVFFCRPPCNLPAIILIRAMNQSIFDLISFYNDTSVDSWCFFYYYYELYNERFLRMCRNFLLLRNDSILHI